ncbi:hypothetical protein TWF569_005387 [Orbilia oligospora]|uniref:Uncharacterized protein n=1 Tax=Orbilia oligospora TaxID=2813651 RepID=A0A7C8J5G2_ORBOL|nr:hypothetical protein TWF102_001570 [Orbilia oligospora]KAF3088237.1 hypothetical protein TWF103_001226 [Orbilia oligospora]KAF3101708.1 hypothetical protein TWF706_005466 [Orbilia oligospora]KAF3148655.1 hypothetical protein TWF569_005387 [Orbilia oligospora]
MKFSITFEITFGRAAGDQGQTEEGRGHSKSSAATPRKSWWTKAREVWACLKGPKKQPKTDQTKEGIEALNRRIVELEGRLEEQGAEDLDQLESIQAQLEPIQSLLWVTNARNIETSTCNNDDAATGEGESSDDTTTSDSQDSQPSTAPIFGGQHEHDVAVSAIGGVLRPEVSWSSLRTYRTGLSGGSGTPDNTVAPDSNYHSAEGGTSGG